MNKKIMILGITLSCFLATSGTANIRSSNKIKIPIKEVRSPTSITIQLVDVVISGTVFDPNGEPVPGVTVSVAGINIGTATDIDGRYKLSVPDGSTLVFSFIGYEPFSIEVGGQSVIDVTLQEDMASWDEVVVV